MTEIWYCPDTLNCPHFEVEGERFVTDKEGKCPYCGFALVEFPTKSFHEGCFR